MPTPCSSAVATAKPAIYSRPPVFSGTSVPWAWPWNSANRPMMATPAETGRSTARATSSPSATTEARIPGSTNGTGTCSMPSTPPNSITPTKASGHAQIARPPLSAAHSPTATITVMWSRPDSGCAKPAAKDDVVPTPTCASAGKTAAISRAARRDTLLTMVEIMGGSFLLSMRKVGQARLRIAAQSSSRSTRLVEAGYLTSSVGRADRPPRKLAAAIRAGAAEHAVRAIGAERAFERADHGFARCRRQILVAAFAIGTQFEHSWPPIGSARGR